MHLFNVRFTIYLEYFLALTLSLTLSTTMAFAFTLIKGSGGVSNITLKESFAREFPTALLAGLFSFLILIAFYYVSLHRVSLPIKILIAMVAMPTFFIAIIILGEALILTIYKELNITLLTLLIIASIYASVILSILSLSGALSVRIRNFTFILYGSFLGAIFGMALPLAAVITTCIFTSIFDAFAITVFFRDEMKKFVSEVSALKIDVSKLIEVGLGDFIFISIIPAMTYYRFELLLSLISSALILIGWILNLILILRRKLIAALPIPVMLGLSPSIALLISYAT